MNVIVVIPARDEEASVGKVLSALPDVREVVLVDNGSSDATGEVARQSGATVVSEPKAGYGRACLAGLEHVARIAEADAAPDIVAFLDADGSDCPEELADILAPIVSGHADLVIGSRRLGQLAGRVEFGALLPQARWGNALACTLIWMRWGERFTDLGPFRAIRYDALVGLGMEDQTFGWTVEMQIRAVRAGLRCAEVPVSYRRRIGRSKITGTVSGSIRAGAMILWTVGKHSVRGSLVKHGDD